MASYVEQEDMLHLRPFSDDGERARVAEGLVHEYTHLIQDRTMENLLRASRGPLEHTREDELRKEIEARRHGNYFLLLMRELGISLGSGQEAFNEELSARVFVSRFERERTGRPAEQAAARTEIRKEVSQAYAAQLQSNAPIRRCLIGIDDSNRALLHAGGPTPIDLGLVPETITTRDALTGHLQSAVERSSVFPSLFVSSNGTVYKIITFIAFNRDRKLADFAIANPSP